jgi:hypothetical protein
MKCRIVCQTDLDYVAGKERCKDLIRAAEHDRFVSAIQPRQPVQGTNLGRWVAGLVSWKGKQPRTT